MFEEKFTQCLSRVEKVVEVVREIWVSVEKGDTSTVERLAAVLQKQYGKFRYDYRGIQAGEGALTVEHVAFKLHSQVLQFEQEAVANLERIGQLT